MDPEIVNELNERLKELSESISRSSTPALENLAKASAAAGQKVDNANKSFQHLDNVAGGFSKALLQGTGQLDGYTKAVESMGAAALHVAKDLGPLGTAAIIAATALTKFAFAQTDSLLKFSDGINRLGAANTFTTIQLQKMANAAGYASSDFQKILKPMQNMGNALGALGNGMGESSKKFAEQISFSSLKVRDQFRELGYGQDDLVQAIADYDTAMFNSGVSLRELGKSAAGLQNASLSYLKNLNDLSAATGDSVDQEKKAQAAGAATLQMQLWINEQNRRMAAASSDAERQRIKTNIENVTALAGNIGAQQGSAAQLAFSQMLNGGPATGEGAKALALTGTGNAVQQAASMANNGGLTAKQTGDITQGLANSMSDFMHNNRGALNVSSDFANAASLNTSTATVLNQRYGFKPGSNPANPPSDLAQGIRNTAADAEIQAKTYLDKFLGNMNPMLHGFNLATAAGVALAAVLTAVTVKLGSQVLGSLFSKGASKSAAGGALGGVESLVGGGGIAKGGMLMGIVEALTAAGAAGPEIAIGGAALGTAIAAIGAGLAGATYLMGNALPNVAKGLKSFNEINGSNLMKAGAGMAGLGVGIVALGAGQITSAWGKLAGILTGDNKVSPLDQAAKELLAFQKYQINGDQVKNNANALVAFSSAMATYKGGPGLGETISHILSSKLNDLFGQDSPVDAFVKFSKMDIGANAEKNSDAFLKFAQALQITGSKSSNKGGPSNTGGIGSALSAGANFGEEAVGAAGGALGALGHAGMGALGAAGSFLGSAGKGALGALGSLGSWVMNLVAGHEGVRNKPYKDSRGLWTVGVGHLIGDGRTLPPEWNREFSNAEVSKLFQGDYEKHRKAASGIPGFSKLNDKGQAALIDMTFNMGPAWYKKWPKLTAALAAGDIDSAANSMAGSLWAKQVGGRAQEDINLLRQGKLQAKYGGMFDGPSTGYPATLHGSEIVAPLTPDSLLMKLAKTSTGDAAALETIVKGKNAGMTSSSVDQAMAKMTAEMYSMMSRKLDTVISVLENSHSTQTKLYRHAVSS